MTKKGKTTKGYVVSKKLWLNPNNSDKFGQYPKNEIN